MIVVIQCAASKRSDAGHLVSAGGKPVVFVADPQSAPPERGHVYARPDDLSDGGKSWRELVLEYNRDSGDNPLSLYPAYQLYQNRAYTRLVERFGVENVYILSAGWGLIRADFLTPYYDITYSQSAEGYKRRRKSDRYQDFCMLPDHPGDDIVFFGGKDYLPLLVSLTARTQVRKTVFYNSLRPPNAPGWNLERFVTTTRTNWHYECAGAFLSSGSEKNKS